MLEAFALGIVDFLFPKSASVYALEALSPSDLLKNLPPAHELGADTAAIFSYAEPRTRDLIWELKYRKNAQIARALASILYDTLCHELAERALLENFTAPLLVPVPMSDKRLRERGWNQIDILCSEMLKLDSEHRFAYAPRTLAKVRHTESQARTPSKRARLSNVERSMRADPALVRDRNIILIDDVTTTGATLTEARRALKEAGAKKILAVTLAH